jgi:hypothetical protein
MNDPQMLSQLTKNVVEALWLPEEAFAIIYPEFCDKNDEEIFQIIRSLDNYYKNTRVIVEQGIGTLVRIENEEAESVEKGNQEILLQTI